MTPEGDGEFRIRTLSTALYLPNFLFYLGRGAAVPVIALLALELGASPAVAGAVVAVRGIGTMAFDLPAGMLISKLGEKTAMVLSAALLGGISTAIWLRPPLWLYAILIGLVGATWSVWHIARIAYAAGCTTPAHRGRVMAVVGGSSRIGQLIGPLIGSLMVAQGGLPGAFIVLAGVSGAAALSMALARSVPFVAESTSRSPGMAQVVRDHRHTLATAGLVAVAAQVLRSSREVLIPLWGDHLSISASIITLLFAASYAIESIIFYPVGMVMDRWGRKWTFLPSLALMSLSTAAIPFTSGVATLTGVALVIGLGNGLGSGMNMTLASDLSPLAGRSRFLGIWHLVTDLGNAAGPLLVAALTSAATLTAAAHAVGGVGLVGLFVMWRLVPETRVTHAPT